MKRKDSIKILLVGVMLATAFASLSSALAEVTEVKMSMQFGLTHLPMMVAKEKKLVKKHLAVVGMRDTKVSWIQLTGSAAMDDALLSGTIDVSSGGITALATLWSATGGKVKALGAETSPAFYLVTTNPRIRSLKDFKSGDKIALPAVGVSPQAIILEMAAKKVFGDYAKLNPLTVTMRHPDAMIALMSGRGIIDAHFANAPFQEEELRNPQARLILNSVDVQDGPATIVVASARTEFYKKNPKTCNAIVLALRQAIDFINNDRAAAARLYIKVTKDKRNSVAQIVKILESPDLKFSFTPHKSMLFIDFMYQHKLIKRRPASWKELYFPDVYDLPGAS